MSYILEALKKSDQQRQRGVTPTLQASQAAVPAPKRLFAAYYGLVAAVLLCAGVAIGWLRPWQAEQPVSTAETIAARPENTSTQVAAKPVSDPPEMTRMSDQKLTVSNSMQVAQAVSGVGGRQTGILPHVSSAMAGASAVASVPVQQKSAGLEVSVREDNATPLTELPPTIQQEIPAMTIQLHSYSSSPINSIVSINSRLLKEGESLAPGLRLEQITQDGVIFSYKGYRFHRGIW
jgi:general secretion pathway protein B